MSRQSIKISVIIPVYNQQKYLAECLQSALGQELKEIEVLCVNDGSTDASAEILKKFQNDDKRVKVLNQKNKGVAAARNRALFAASGEYVCFLDGDDFYPDKFVLNKLYLAARNSGAYVCGGSWSETEGGLLRTNFFYPYEGFTFVKTGWINYFDYQFDYGFQRFIYERNFLLSQKITFPLYRRYQDPVFFVKTMLAAKRFYAIEAITYHYRIGHQNWAEWSREKWQDLALGLSNVMYIAQSENLCKLADYTCKRIEDAAERLLTLLVRGESNFIEGLLMLNEAFCGDNADFPLLSSFEKIVYEMQERGKEIENIRRSYSYRIGRAVTFLPRILLKYLKK